MTGKKEKGARGEILMRLFGSGAMKFPPPLLPPNTEGGRSIICAARKWGLESEAQGEEMIGNKENELTSNAWFTYTDLKLPVVSLFQCVVARERNEFFSPGGTIVCPSFECRVMG